MLSRSSYQIVIFGGMSVSFAIVGYIVGRHAGSPLPFESLSKTATAPRSFASAVRSANTPETIIETRPSGSLTADFISKWSDLQKQTLTPSSEEIMRSWLQALGATDPFAAFQLAQSAANPRLHEVLRNAVLRGWATTDAEAASKWALSQVRPEERRAAVEAIASGAVVHPEEAIRAFKHLIEADPSLASDHGNMLVQELAHIGRFDLASQFAEEGLAENRASWLSTAYSRWAEYQPEAALAAAAALSMNSVRSEALQGVINGWASSDPAALVTYAQHSMLGETRVLALRDGLLQWVSRDPVAASNWMDSLDPSADLDPGAAAVATAPALIEKKPDVAASWAESITDPELRSNTLLDLIRLWSTTDLTGARRYAATSPALRPETRDLALSSLETSP